MPTSKSAFLFAVAAAAALLPGRVHAADRLRLERIDLSDSPGVRMYLTYVDSEGRVVAGRQREEFHLILDSADQGGAVSGIAFDAQAPPEEIYVVIVAQLSSAMNEVVDDLKRGVKQLANSFDSKSRSKMALLGYASDTKRIVEMSAPAEVESAAGTMAIDSEGVEVHMLDAMRTAIDLLNAAPKNERKLIVLFSDGIDLNMDRRAFQSVGKKALEAQIAVDTIGFAPFEPGRLRNLRELARQSNGSDRQAKNAGDIAAQFASVAEEIKKQYVVRFETALAGGDNKDHTFQADVEAEGRSAYSNTVTAKMPKPVRPTTRSQGVRWWAWLFSGMGSLALAALLIWLMSRDRDLAIERPTPAVLPPPAPPQRTLALDLGGGGPCVGWIVGMSGTLANRTFRFKPARTVIGTASDCDIVVEDQFMSSRHCEVRVEERGVFRIVDLGSTNGVVVNDKKVREHELVDNDLFRLGRSEFKFKSID